MESHARLSAESVQKYNEQGYLIVPEAVLEPEKFKSLSAYFEKILSEVEPGARPEALDVPHFIYPELFQWVFDPAVLDLVEPILGPDIALFSTHFLSKPRGDGKRVPWHEDSFYWRNMLDDTHSVVTIWLAIDPSTTKNGCMYVVPGSHRKPDSEYEDVDTEKNVFPLEIRDRVRIEALAVPVELEPNHASLHNSGLIHGSPPNTSDQRRCGYTMRFMSTSVRFNQEAYGEAHHLYLARGRDRAGNVYADPTRAYPEKLAERKLYKKSNLH